MAYLKQDVIWVDFWNQNGTKYVPKLSTYALRKGMMTLEKTIVYGDKTRPLLDWLRYEKLKVFTEDEDLAPKLIDYYKPFREVLARANLMSDYQMLIRSGSNYGIIPGDVENFDWFDSELEMHISRFFNFPSGNGKFGQFPGREKPGNREKLLPKSLEKNLTFFAILLYQKEKSNFKEMYYQIFD